MRRRWSTQRNPVVFAMSTSYMAVVLALILALSVGVFAVLTRRRAVAQGAAWAGGLRRLQPEITYTATGFVNPVRVIFQANRQPGRHRGQHRSGRPAFPHCDPPRAERVPHRRPVCSGASRPRLAVARGGGAKNARRPGKCVCRLHSARDAAGAGGRRGPPVARRRACNPAARRHVSLEAADAMPKTHPHAEASYRVIPCDDGSFGVLVSIPDSHPTRVSPFATAADAEAWIADHQRRVQAQSSSGGWFRRPGARGR